MYILSDLKWQIRFCVFREKKIKKNDSNSKSASNSKMIQKVTLIQKDSKRDSNSKKFKKCL